MHLVPEQFASSKQMKMEMVYLLSSIIAVVGDKAVAGFVQADFGGDLLDEGCYLGHQLCGCRLETVDMLFRNDENMDRCLGVEIMKRQETIIFRYSVIGYLSLYDLTKKTHIFSPFGVIDFQIIA